MNGQDNASFDVLGIGRAYVDVIAEVGHDFLEQHGIPLDTGRYFDAAAVAAIVAQLSSPAVCPGGAIPNTLAGLAALGARTGYFSKVARDELGQAFCEDLDQRGITPLCASFVTEAEASGTCVVLLTEGGERSFALHKGCVDSFSEDDFASFDFSRARFVMIGANLLAQTEDPAPFALALARAREAGCRVVVSLSEVRLWDGREAYAKDVVRGGTDILIGNSIETEALLAAAREDVPASCLQVVTLGAKGAEARLEGEAYAVEPYRGANLVSSLGAGDQFLAGFLKGRSEGWGVPSCLNLAARCAAAILQVPEARPAVGEDWRAMAELDAPERKA